MQKSNYSSIETIIKIAKKGGMFILVDDEKRENEGDLVISTSDTNSKNINFMAKYGRGLICLALDSLQAKRLNLSLMSPVNQSRNKTAFTVSIEAKKGITTGKVLSVKKVDKSYIFDFEINSRERKNIIEKASIWINGISLTISKVTKKGFQIWVIPHTYKLTNLSKVKKGNFVNVEIDILSKYVKNFFNEKK